MCRLSDQETIYVSFCSMLPQCLFRGVIFAPIFIEKCQYVAPIFVLPQYLFKGVMLPRTLTWTARLMAANSQE